jgi:O-methyltransferase
MPDPIPDNAYVASEFEQWHPAEPTAKVRAINRVLAGLGTWSRLAPPRFTGVQTNVEQRVNIYHLLSQVLVFGVPGDVVELGCHEGHSSVILQRIIDAHDPSRRLHLYDSFQGLPELDEKDRGTHFRPGTILSTADVVLENFRRRGLREPVIHQGWFEDTLPTGLPERICFAYLDGDLYDSILCSLVHVYPRLSENGICLIDDYGRDLAPGVEKACDEFLADKPERVTVLYSADMPHAFFRKQPRAAGTVGAAAGG